MQTLLGKHWHHLPVGEVITLLESNLQSGLDVFEVKHRQEHCSGEVVRPGVRSQVQGETEGCP